MRELRVHATPSLLDWGLDTDGDGCPDSCPDPCAVKDGLICELGHRVDPCEGVQCPVGSFEGNCIVVPTPSLEMDADACTNPCEPADWVRNVSG